MQARMPALHINSRQSINGFQPLQSTARCRCYYIFYFDYLLFMEILTIIYVKLRSQKYVKLRIDRSFFCCNFAPSKDK